MVVVIGSEASSAIDAVPLDFAHVVCASCLPIGVPSRESRSVLDDISGSPGDSLFVHGAGGFVVGTKDVEVASPNPIEHEFDDLFGRPGAGWLCGRTRQAGEGETGYEQ